MQCARLVLRTVYRVAYASFDLILPELDDGKCDFNSGLSREYVPSVFITVELRSSLRAGRSECIRKLVHTT